MNKKLNEEQYPKVIEKEEESPQKPPTSAFYQWSFLLIAFGCIPLLYGFVDRSKINLAIGLCMNIVGIIFIFLGKHQKSVQKKKLLKGHV
ncbi:MAG: hypothetical protein A2161_17005 [Candidatus Schekmanbacteria bacterium RBG_13_48_7]|uniref:Uncharacterized protein n=1 Tax=Candidatus Schekmanbacteria bacterium RBG_13_48_7 TaxID=1817878 RepID=A0A1F7RRB3_9BACT|nr:MAG: hypothetical protein A2161_17005 [Candidatus Schekmanbacteria bacterium RBG_13_48_7]